MMILARKMNFGPNSPAYVFVFILGPRLFIFWRDGEGRSYLRPFKINPSKLTLHKGNECFAMERNWCPYFHYMRRNNFILRVKFQWQISSTWTSLHRLFYIPIRPWQHMADIRWHVGTPQSHSAIYLHCVSKHRYCSDIQQYRNN